MNKKLVRLSESDLHKIVKESVNNVLTELDWRTYAKAVQKAREQGRDSRWNFDRATERALDKQYDHQYTLRHTQPYPQIRQHQSEQIFCIPYIIRYIEKFPSLNCMDSSLFNSFFTEDRNKHKKRQPQVSKILPTASTNILKLFFQILKRAATYLSDVHLV